MNTPIDPTPRPKVPSPLQFTKSVAPTRFWRKKKAVRRNEPDSNNGICLRKDAQKNANYKALTTRAKQGVLTVADAMSAPRIFDGLKSCLASERQVLQLDASGRLLQVMPVGAFVFGETLLTRHKKLTAQHALVEDSKFSARLLFDWIRRSPFVGVKRESARERGVDLSSSFQMLVNRRATFTRSLQRESEQFAELVEAASQIDVALVFLPEVIAPLPVRKSLDSEPARPAMPTPSESIPSLPSPTLPRL